MRARSGLASLAVLALLGACGVQPSEGPEQTALQATSFRPLLELMEEAPTGTVYTMVRRYEAHWNDGTGPQTLAYTEEVFSDGTGQFGIEPTEVFQPSMGSSAEALFLLVQEQRAGFFFRYRDFNIQDLDVFLRHWQVFDAGVTTQVVGRTCAQLEVRRRSNSVRTYHLAVDIENGLVLRSEERDSLGNVLTLLEVESLDLTPDLSGRLYHQPVARRTTLNPANPTQTGLPFTPVEPKLVPQGYELLQATEIDDTITGESWAEFVYSDGLEKLFFLHGGPQQGQQSTAGGSKKNGRAKWIALGPWTVVWGNANGERFMVMGKQSRAALFDIIESGFY